MVRKSCGLRRGTRRKLRAKLRCIKDSLKDFKPGSVVHIDFDSRKKMPHPKFQGRTGIVLAKQGRAFKVKFKDKNKEKVLLLKAEHLQ
jgi:large subunit ribosomal protein L21e